jgi:hypothetical protein
LIWLLALLTDGDGGDDDVANQLGNMTRHVAKLPTYVAKTRFDVAKSPSDVANHVARLATSA